MCLTIHTKKELLSEAIQFYKKVAKRDITVYKRFRKPYKWGNGSGSGLVLKSPHRDFSYQMNFHYYNEGPLEKRFGFSLNPGSKFQLNPGFKLQISEGLHAYTNLATAKYNVLFKEKVIKCIVPKGSTYYVSDKDNEICSDNLIITDQIVE